MCFPRTRRGTTPLGRLPLAELQLHERSLIRFRREISRHSLASQERTHEYRITAPPVRQWVQLIPAFFMTGVLLGVRGNEPSWHDHHGNVYHYGPQDGVLFAVSCHPRSPTVLDTGRIPPCIYSGTYARTRTPASFKRFQRTSPSSSLTAHSVAVR